jgi:hypothetical protein
MLTTIPPMPHSPALCVFEDDLLLGGLMKAESLPFLKKIFIFFIYLQYWGLNLLHHPYFCEGFF